MKKHVLLLFSFLFCTLMASGQNSIRGTVTSETDNEPIIGANVTVKGTTNYIRTIISVSINRVEQIIRKLYLRGTSRKPMDIRRLCIT